MGYLQRGTQALVVLQMRHFYILMHAATLLLLADTACAKLCFYLQSLTHYVQIVTVLPIKLHWEPLLLNPRYSFELIRRTEKSQSHIDDCQFVIRIIFVGRLS